MDTYASMMADPKKISEAAQKKAGQPIGTDMDERHKKFVKELSDMITQGKIDPEKIETFVKKDIYAKLKPEVKAQTDQALPNIATQLRHIIGFYRSKETPDASPQLQTMIEDLWQMKERIEKHADVFVF